MRWLEIAPGFDCNCRCTGCHSCSADASQQMSSPEVLRALQDGRRRGARHLWLGGGEPSIRRDFLPILRAATTLGYERRKVQTNGLLFAYPEFVDRAVAAGMTEANLLLKSLDPAVHDALMGRDGALALLDRGLDNLRGRVRLEGDVLLTTRNAHELPTLVRHYAARGVERFSLWLFSTADAGDAALVPRLTDLAPLLVEARKEARAAGVGLVSLHTPRCLVPPDCWDLQFDPAGMDLHVLNPGGQAFALHDSAMERGVHVAGCDGCAVRGPCRGLRPDYVAIHGASEARAVPPEAASGHDPRGSVLDLPG